MYDILFLSETCQKNSIENFYVECLHVTKIKKRMGRYSGGILVLIKDDIKRQVKLLPDKKRKYGIWLKIDKTTLYSNRDLYMGEFICHLRTVSMPYKHHSKL